MRYKEWFDEHAKKHAKIIKELGHLDQDELIAYFDFDHMKSAHPDFCPLYAMDQKCHDTLKLNCYFCACMHFRFDDNGIKTTQNGKTLYSYCAIESKNRALFEDEKSIHNDCSNCTIPHRQKEIEKYFSRDWSEVMKECDLSKDTLS